MSENTIAIVGMEVIMLADGNFLIEISEAITGSSTSVSGSSPELAMHEAVRWLGYE